MSERAVVSSVFNVPDGTAHHVLEIDALAKAPLVFAENGLKDLEESLSALAHLQGRRLLCTIVDLVSAILEVAQEGPDQRREAVDHADLCDLVIDLDVWDWPSGDVWFKLLGQGIEQPPFFALPAVGFDQDGLMLGVDLPLPVHPSQIFLAIDEWGRCQFLCAVRPPFLSNAEMLEIDTAFGQAKIRCVGPPPGARELVLIGGFILVGDTVPVEPIGDQQLLKTVDRLALLGSQIEAFDL